MKVFDKNAFLNVLKAVDDTALNRAIAELGISSDELIKDGGETLSLMTPFLKFMACSSPADSDVPDVEGLIKMAEHLDELNDVLCNRHIHSITDVVRRASVLKSVGRRIL